MANVIQNLLERPFSVRSIAEQLEIVKRDRPRPALPDLVLHHKDKKAEYTRHFSACQYDTVRWLTGCETLNRLFCWPCLLFSKEESTVWNKYGFFDLNHFTTAQLKHERTKFHIQSCLQLAIFGDSRLEILPDTQNKREYNELVKKNLAILRRIIDMICYFAKQDLPLGNVDESLESLNKNSYIELVKLLQTYDPTLDGFLAKSSFQEISPKIVNSTVRAIVDIIKDSIQNEIKASVFVSIILNETYDGFSHSQVSKVLRYVVDGSVYERFIGFSDLSADRTVDRLFSHISNVIKEFQIDDKLIAYSYNGGSISHFDLELKVAQHYPKAIFTHYDAHILNVVLQKNLLNIKECRMFFHTLHEICIFSNGSLKKRRAFEEFGSALNIAPQSWEFPRLIYTLRKFRFHLLGFFEGIAKESDMWEIGTGIKACAFASFLNDFQTGFLLHVFSKLFTCTEELHNLINFKKDISICSKQIEDFLGQLKNSKDYSFEEVWLATLRSKTENGETSSKRFHMDDNLENVYRHLYYNIVNAIEFQIKYRYSSMLQFEFVHLFLNDKFEKYKEKFPDTLTQKVNKVYGPLFDYLRLKNELSVLYSSTHFSGKPISDLVKFMIQNDLCGIFKESFRLANLILTLPSTDIGGQPLALERINNYCHKTEGQKRLNAMSFLSIEKGLLWNLKRDPSFVDNVIEKLVDCEPGLELLFK